MFSFCLIPQFTHKQVSLYSLSSFSSIAHPDADTSGLNLQRVMPRSFFLLLRFYLRVDGVLVRVNDTRLYHEADQAYMLREYTSRQSLASDLKVSRSAVS